MAAETAQVARGAARGAVRLLHSSDLHVDDDMLPGRYNGHIGLQAVLRTAAAAGADLVLLAGDTFDNARVSLPVLQRTAEILAAAPVPVVMLPGNHDPILPDGIFARSGIADIAHVHILGLTAGPAVLFEAHDLEIRGRAHHGFGDMDPLHPPRPRAATWQVVIAHGHYVPPEDWQAESHRSWRISDADLAATGADYIALGHWDRPTPVGIGPVPAYYSGSPDLARTANLIRLCPREGVRIERTPLLWE